MTSYEGRGVDGMDSGMKMVEVIETIKGRSYSNSGVGDLLRSGLGGVARWFKDCGIVNLRRMFRLWYFMMVVAAFLSL